MQQNWLNIFLLNNYVKIRKTKGFDYFQIGAWFRMSGSRNSIEWILINFFNQLFCSTGIALDIYAYFYSILAISRWSFIRYIHIIKVGKLPVHNISRVAVKRHDLDRTRFFSLILSNLCRSCFLGFSRNFVR